MSVCHYVCVSVCLSFFLSSFAFFFLLFFLPFCLSLFLSRWQFGAVYRLNVPSTKGPYHRYSTLDISLWAWPKHALWDAPAILSPYNNSTIRLRLSSAFMNAAPIHAALWMIIERAKSRMVLFTGVHATTFVVPPEDIRAWPSRLCVLTKFHW